MDFYWENVPAGRTLEKGEPVGILINTNQKANRTDLDIAQILELSHSSCWIFNYLKIDYVKVITSSNGVECLAIDASLKCKFFNTLTKKISFVLPMGGEDSGLFLRMKEEIGSSPEGIIDQDRVLQSELIVVVLPLDNRSGEDSYVYISFLRWQSWYGKI